MARQSRNSTSTRQTTSEQGFSLIELLLVVAVILIIAGIAIPNYLRSKMRANEAAAVANMRTITTAEVSYTTTYGIGFSLDLISLADNPSGIVDQSHASLIDEVLAHGQKNGYSYTYTVVNQDSLGHVTDYAVTADPLVPNTTGTRHFYADQSGTIRSNDSTTASSSDSPLQ
jgi:type IV pilus assembly protein PilA